jgi:hypothetical protein
MMALLYWYFLAAIVLDHAHLVCPIYLGWSNRGFRTMMLERWGKFILLPLSLLALSVWIGLNTSKSAGWVSLSAMGDYRLWMALLRGWKPPNLAFVLLAVTYVWWNAWHFGSQHFGVAALLGWRSGPRWFRRLILVAPTMALMLVGNKSWPSIIIAGEIISFFHWTADIGMTARVLRRHWWWFLPAILVVGLIGFVWKTTNTTPEFCGVLPACTVVWSVPLLLSLRYGFGFWHFLMSRWVWLSEGRALLRAA